MHDWSLVSIEMDWAAGSIVLSFQPFSSTGVEVIRAEKVIELVIPKHEPWGKSVSVNSISELKRLDSGAYRVQLEMQSGDVIVIEAGSIKLPL